MIRYFGGPYEGSDDEANDIIAAANRKKSIEKNNVDELLEEIYSRADWGMIPDYMHQELKDYIELGATPRAFLSCMLSRDIYNAVWCSDISNEGSIADWVKFLEWFVPKECHGSEEKMRDWIAVGGCRGKDDTVVVEEISTNY